MVWVGLAGPVLLAVAITVGGFREPGYGHDEPVSLLAAEGARMAPLVVPAFLLSGLSLLVISVALGWMRFPLGRVVPVLGFVAGGLVVGSALARCSPGCPAPWSGEAQVQDVVHFSLVLPAMWGFAAAPIVAWRRLRRLEGWTAFRRLTAASTVPILVGGILTFTAEALPVPVFVGTTGIWQRIAIGASLLWFGASALLPLGRWSPDR